MAGHRNFDELREGLSRRPDSDALRAKAKADLDAEIAAFEKTLGDLRRAHRLTQVQLAKTLGVSQAQISRIESQADLYLSTLVSYLDAMGADLHLVAVSRDTGEQTVLSIGDATSAGQQDDPADEISIEDSSSAPAVSAEKASFDVDRIVMNGDYGRS